MAKNLILVEDMNDALIFKAIIAYMQKENLEVSPTLTPNEQALIEYEKFDTDPNPQKPTALIRKFNSLKNDFNSPNPNRRFGRVGIVFDMDKFTKKERISMINIALKSAYNDAVVYDIEDINNLVKVVFDVGTASEFTVEFACHFINIGGSGELEDLLVKIKNQDSHFADCLYEGWQKCFESKGKILSDEDPKRNITNKELKKLWVDFYKRFDIIPKRRDGDNTKWDNFLKDYPNAFDFGKDTIPELKALKDFLIMLNT